MQIRVTHRVYGLPIALFIFLAIFFVSAGIYLENEEKSARISKASSVAEQVRISLEVFSSERIQAINNLMRTWPTFEPNQIDWFNAQAVSLMGMQKGFSGLIFIDENGVIQWAATPSEVSSARLSTELIGQPMDATGLSIPAISEQFTSTLIYSVPTQHHHILLGRAISPQEPSHGYVIAGFDVQTILSVMLGQLVGPQFNFELASGENILFKSGDFKHDGSVVSTKDFWFIDQLFSLSMQSQTTMYQPGKLIILIGLFMSALVSWVFHKQLKGALHLSLSEQRYLTASEAALDAMLIYQPHGNNYRLVEANRYSRFLFKGAWEKLSAMSLKGQLAFLGLQIEYDKVKQVAVSGQPYEGYFAIESTKVAPQWVKVQVVKAGANIALTVRDVTERFNAQRELKQSEERYKRLVDGLHRHFVYTKTATHKFIYVSAGINTILGYSAEYFCANESSLVKQVPDETLGIRNTILRGQKPEPYLVHYVGGAGKEHVLEFSDTPILDENGHIIAVEGIARDVTKEQALQAEVVFQANHDQLTGLLNRYAFDNQLRAILSERDCAHHNATESTNVTPIGATVAIEKHTSVMCFIDMDRFKLVNDSCGHPAGDKLLKEISTLFRQHVNDNDLLARIGGDEFCIIYRAETLSRVKAKLDQLLKAISGYRFVYDDKLFFVGASIGVIEIGARSVSAAELIKAADNACYRAKHLGRNRYFIVHPNDEYMGINNNENDVLHTLHRALQDDGFELYSQAILPLNVPSASSQQHYEILLRLTASDGSLISPNLFIPLAERHGLMNKVDMWVVDNTLRVLETNPAHLDSVGKVAINLSGITLGDETTLLAITQRIQNTCVPAEKICFEITETTAVTNLNAAKHFISTLRALGCSFALDDFGAGMSSFTYLKNLDVDYVKIDGSFVRNIAHDHIDHATVKAINNIAHSMGKQTVAEFVVNSATAEVLKQLGVNFGQGFALDKPKPLAHRVQWRLKKASV